MYRCTKSSEYLQLTLFTWPIFNERRKTRRKQEESETTEKYLYASTISDTCESMLRANILIGLIIAPVSHSTMIIYIIALYG